MMVLFFSTIFLCFSFFVNKWLVVFMFVSIYLYLLRLFPVFYDYQTSCFYLDTASFNLAFLSFFLGVAMVISMYNHYKKYPTLMLFLINLLMFFLLMSFMSFTALLFYFFFECSLIPTFLLIMGWGFQPERIQASLYFMFYTLFSSLPLLLVMVFISVNYFSMSFFSISCFSVEKNLTYIIISIFLYMAFLVKLPMYFFHLWLPKAHVEAPVAGSMILAGVLLKLGGYGIIRMIPFCPPSISLLSPLLYSISLCGMFICSLICCRMNDLKSLVAYSSVAHMGLVLSGCVTTSCSGYSGCIFMMVAHGLSSSGLFCIMNLYYERTSSRSMFINKGLGMVLPSLGLSMFLLCCSNISSPPTISLISELFLLFSMLEYSYYMMLMFSLSTFFCSVFTFFLYSFTQQGKSFSSYVGLGCLNSREYHLMFLHIFPIYGLFSFSNFLFI